jgi:hypothetical protein
MRKRPKKVVVYEKYGHFFMVYVILTVRLITSEEQPASSSIASNTPRAASDHHPPPNSSQTYVNLLHLRLFHHYNADLGLHLYPNELASEIAPKTIKYSLSFPFLMYEMLQSQLCI